MSKWNKLGTYLSRVIVSWHAPTLDLVKFEDLSSSVVLIYIDNVNINEKEIDMFFENIFRCEPLAVHLGGKMSEHNFDILLDKKMPRGKHIMTYLTKGQNMIKAIEDYFYSSWPSEDRYNEWNEYKIIFIGDTIGYNKFCAKLNESLLYENFKNN